MCSRVALVKRVLTAAVLAPLVLIIVFRAPLWIFALLAGVVAVLATREYLDIAQGFGFPPFRKITLIIVAICFALLTIIAASLGRPRDLVALALPVLLMAAPFIFLLAALQRSNLKTTLPAAGFSFLALPYIFMPLSLLVLLRMLSQGWFLLLFLFFTVWGGDIGAYYVGKNFGKRKLAPRVSPNKSWEGAMASLVSSIVIGIILIHYATFIWSGLSDANLLVRNAANAAPAPLWIAVLLAGAINIAAQFGDLVESMLKRGAEMKDSGSILPGHGGILDRIDALLFATPVGVLLFLITYRYFNPFFP